MIELGQEVSRNGRVTKKPAAAKQEAPFKLVHIPADWHLSDVWEFVREGILEVLHKSKGYYKYRPEDAYLALRLQKANLYLAHWRGELKGFGITQVNADPFGNEPPHLLSWIGYCSHHETMLAYFEELKIIAKSFKLGEIRHASTRKGWLISKPGPDWETLTSKGWVRDLTPEQIHGFDMAPEFVQRVKIDG